MVKLNIYFLNKEDFKKWKKGVEEFEDVIRPNPKTEFHKKVFEELISYLKNIDYWLKKFYRVGTPNEIKEIDLVIVDRYPYSTGRTYFEIPTSTILIGINEEDPAWGKKGNFVYLIHEFGHIYQNYFLEKKYSLSLDNYDKLNKEQQEFFDKIHNITHGVIELLAEFQVRKFLGLIKDYWEQNESKFSPGHSFTKEYRDEIYKKLYKKWENWEIKDVYGFFEESLKLFKV